MNGQWVGTFHDSAGDGNIIVNIDERETCYEGVAYTHPTNVELPRAAAFFKTKNKESNCELRTAALLPIDPHALNFAPWDVIKSKYHPDTAFSTFADVKMCLTGSTLVLSWNTDVGITGNCELLTSRASEPSELSAAKMSWSDFKRFLPSLQGKRHLFRGQSSSHRLRTSFHRSGRADISRFHREDIPVLRNHLSARTRHVFNFDIPDEFGAFLNLIQHHGYPTPLLDWTYSPYVGAFFAYRRITNEMAAKADPDAMVRVFVFDQSEWRADWQQILLLLFPGLHLSIGEFMAIENERMIPQQAASTITSVDDIESFIKEKEDLKSKKYLTAIDLPVRERRDIVRDLRYMGITAGSLFPGLDGACEELKDRNFEI
jgi:FRG domain